MVAGFSASIIRPPRRKLRETPSEETSGWPSLAWLTDESSILKLENAIGGACEDRTMRRDENGSACMPSIIQIRNDLAFGLGIDLSGGFIAEENWRFSREGHRQTGAGRLASRQFGWQGIPV